VPASASDIFAECAGQVQQQQQTTSRDSGSSAETEALRRENSQLKQEVQVCLRRGRRGVHFDSVTRWLQQLKSKPSAPSGGADAASGAEVGHVFVFVLNVVVICFVHPMQQIKRLTDQVAQLQKIIQQDDMKQMMMDFASTTQAELEAERGELQVALAVLRFGLIALVLFVLVHC
jgi:hypothetical protein